MRMDEKDLDRLYILLAVLVGTLAYLAPHAASQAGPGPNNSNYTVSTTLNITNSFPEVLDVRMSNVTLNAGGTKGVNCTATIRDFDGIGTVQTVNGTFFDQSVANFDNASDNNYHYFNSSCTLQNNNSDTGNYTCTFPVEYYANSGSNWNCTVIAEDDQAKTDNGSTTTTIDPLLALNVTPQSIDYGDLAVTDVSNIREANVTNFGNVQINLSVFGYGNQTNDGLAMLCDEGNISVEYERFSDNSSAQYGDMINLSSTNKDFPDVSMIQRTNDSVNDILNNTYWRIQVPSSSNPSGICNGFIVFQAESS